MKSEQYNSAQIAAFNQSLIDNRLMTHVQGCEFDANTGQGSCGFFIFAQALEDLAAHTDIDPDIVGGLIQTVNGYCCVLLSVNENAVPNSQGYCQALHGIKPLVKK